MEMQFIPYQLAEYEYELVDTLIAASKESSNAGSGTESDLDIPNSPPTIVRCLIRISPTKDHQRWIQKHSP